MIKEAIEFLLELKKPETIFSGNREYSTIDIEPIKEPICEELHVYNLKSLVGYLKDDPDAHKAETKIINIIEPTKVVVESATFGDFKQRERFIVADYSELIPNFLLSQYLSIEEFIIMLKTRFIMTEDLEKIIKLVGNIQDENITNYNDDGITQKVVTKTGIARVEETALPPKIKLKPFRTFAEVEQPESEFLLRGKKNCDGIKFALFEADGGFWKQEAINNIADYLKNELVDISNTIILN